MNKIHPFLFSALLLLGTSCGGNNDSKKPTTDNKEKKDTTNLQMESKEVVDSLAGISGFCKPFFLVGNELTFVQERIETVDCYVDQETGETVAGEGITAPKITKETIKVTVTKVEKNKKGVWVATLKHNGDFSKKWYTDEKSIWNDNMTGKFPVDPKQKDREIDGVSTSIYFNKGSWSYDEQQGDGMSGIHFNAEKGISEFVFAYSSVCETIELITKLKSSKY